VTKFDPSVPSVARIYDYFLGGKDNYASDREAANRIAEIEPDAASVARQNRAFLGRAVRYLSEKAGIRQFLDIGTGIPTAGNTHQVAQATAPQSRVVYVDNDKIVLAHARALLDSTPEGKCGYIDSDLRDTGARLRSTSPADRTAPRFSPTLGTVVPSVAAYVSRSSSASSSWRITRARGSCGDARSG
jgi:hypothetical protein